MKIISRTYPFTEIHLKKFRKELDRAGGFDNLMLKKQALKHEMQMKYICLVKDMEAYRIKHLKGAYRDLRPMFNTETPYVFWNRLYEKLMAIEADP